ncbi:DNA-binding MarR family transcriptional regulator [Microbacterium endophyticum]|uniref:DNA-binding MarR family transcriptional regulator n=1 Tax=Microbacterium endophyticum TaxID=1526412 RepID=A0A7W4V1C9_9MICO|nr:MarR family transcriptional regulator [Microbacterium endophyticum]MBB2974749.1 DNA-binding MarR family transcriptional regulator [Microbacterium endophyticum]NIK37046.1 DNA-binding MarR family transcriptional regulator [Microbacterium endophyticum]
MNAGSSVEITHDERVRETLLALRSLTDSLDRMHGALKDAMGMNGTDLAALRMMVIREERGESVSPHDVARHLHISTASTTKLLDRLTAAGFVERHRHPHDRRSRIVVLTKSLRQTFGEHFGTRMSPIRDVVEQYNDQDLAVIGRFLSELSQRIEDTQ